MTGVVASVMVFPGLAYMYKWLDELGRGQSAKNRLAFKRLLKRRMIRLKRGQGSVRLILTAKGKSQWQRDQLGAFRILRPKVWDGKWRLVMFDLPEGNRGARDMLRQRLRSFGFVSLQKSVFVHPYPCHDLVERLRGYYKLQPGQLYVFDAFVKEGEAVLRKHFKL